MDAVDGELLGDTIGEQPGRDLTHLFPREFLVEKKARDHLYGGDPGQTGLPKITHDPFCVGVLEAG